MLMELRSGNDRSRDRLTPYGVPANCGVIKTTPASAQPGLAVRRQHEGITRLAHHAQLNVPNVAGLWRRSHAQNSSATWLRRVGGLNTSSSGLSA